MNITVEGIVIREVNVGESDKILTILTAERGKITASAKGARRLKSQKLAASSLLVYSKFSLGGSGGHFYVSSAQPLASFYDIRLSVEKTALACYFAELSSFMSGENMPNEELLNLLLNTLFVLAKKDIPLSCIKAVFEMRLLSVCGHMPDLVGCKECLRYEGKLYFTYRGGYLLCEGCLSKKEWGDTPIPVPQSVLTAMRYIVYCEPKKLFSFTLSDAGYEILQGAAEGYLLAQLDHRFPTLAFYKSIT